MKTPLRRTFSIRAKIIGAVAGTLIIAQAGAALLIRRVVNDYALGQKIATADILTTSILHDLKYDGAQSLARGSEAIIAKYMTYYRDVIRMTIYDDSLRVLATSVDRDSAAPPRISPDVVAAAHEARPSLHAVRADSGDLEIRSIAPVMQGSRIVGALDLEISIRDVEKTLAAIDHRILWILSIKLVLVAVVLFILLREAILKRLSHLTAVTRSIAGGRYDAHVDDKRQDEIGALAQAFNKMTQEVRRSKQEIEEHNRDLQRRVDEATREAVKAYDDLKNAQSHLVLNEKMASLGVLIAGIAHEINTPVGAILNVSRVLDRSVRGLPKETEWMQGGAGVPLETLRSCLEELVRAPSETAAPTSYKDLQALERLLQELGVPNHRVTASLLARFNFTDPGRVRRYGACFRLPSFLGFAESLASIAQVAKISETSSQKIGEIVRALKYYAYSDKDRVDQIQINESIQTALVLLRNQLKHSVRVVTEYDPDLPKVACSSDIHQIWTNLLTNAMDAIQGRAEKEEGRIEIATQVDGGDLLVTVEDNGVGIPPAILGKIFDPFFTTKDIGKGTGLGLCIVAGIVKKHGGTVQVDSRPGRTTFAIRLPIRRRPAADESPDRPLPEAA